MTAYRSLPALVSVTGSEVLGPIWSGSADSNVTPSVLKAFMLASSALTGTPTAPTATPGTNTTQVASCAFVTAAIAAIPSGGGGSGSGTVTSVAVSGGATGLTTAGGPITGAGTITISGTLAVTNGGTGATSAGGALTNLGAAPLASPPFTGTPTVPTATAGTNTTQIASTAFVTAAIAAIPSSTLYRSVAGTTDTPTVADDLGTVECLSSSATTITINHLGAGKSYVVRRTGSGTVTLAAGAGVTLTSDQTSPSYAVKNRYGTLTVFCTGVAGTVSVNGAMT